MFKKMSKKTKLIIVSVLGLALAIGGFFGARLLIQTSQYRRIVSEIELQTPDLSRVQDGTWSGHFHAILVSADVDVVVESGIITNVVITNHDHGSWDQARDAEVVATRVVDAQHLYVDTVVGATNSSLVILQAIQNALESGLR